MIKLFFVVCMTIASANNILRYAIDDGPEYFDAFLKTYNKVYSEAEKKIRYEIFLKNLQEINTLNEQSELTEYGITQFTDLTTEELLEAHTCYERSDDSDICIDSDKMNLTRGDVPDEYDWRTKGVITDAKNQGDCGSCWAFSAIGNVESAYAIQTGQLLSLSEQELVDCDKLSGGCKRGNPAYAIKYLKDNGAMTENDYPYEARDDQCRYDPKKAKVKVAGCMFVQGNEDHIAEKLVQIGPLAIGMDSRILKPYYNGGIVHGSRCEGQRVNHGVLLVGYGKDANGTRYWVAKNSWGAQWGENGYFRMERGVNCGLITEQPLLSAIVQLQ